MEMVAIGSPSGLHAEQGIAACRQRPARAGREADRRDRSSAPTRWWPPPTLAGVRLGVFFQDHVQPDLVRLHDAIARRPARTAAAGVGASEVVPAAGVLRPVALARHVGARRRRRADEPGHSHRRPAAVAAWTGASRLGQGGHGAPRDRGGGHGRRAAGVRQRRGRDARGDDGRVSPATGAGSRLIGHRRHRHRRTRSHRRGRPAGARRRSRRPRRRTDQNASASSPVVSDSRGHQRLFEDFFDAIRESREPRCSGRDARQQRRARPRDLRRRSIRGVGRCSALICRRPTSSTCRRRRGSSAARSARAAPDNEWHMWTAGSVTAEGERLGLSNHTWSHLDAPFHLLPDGRDVRAARSAALPGARRPARRPHRHRSRSPRDRRRRQLPHPNRRRGPAAGPRRSRGGAVRDRLRRALRGRNIRCSDGADAHYPHVTREAAAKRLAALPNLRVAGIDGPSFDKPETNAAAHRRAARPAPVADPAARDADLRAPPRARPAAAVARAADDRAAARVRHGRRRRAVERLRVRALVRRRRRSSAAFSTGDALGNRSSA